MNAFAVNGKYAGSVLRVDKKLIIDVDSNVMALRIVEDSAFWWYFITFTFINFFINTYKLF